LTDTERLVTMGDVIDASLQKALCTWRADYAPAIAVEDLLANHVRRVRIACNLLPEGALQVMVKVQARRAADDDVYFFKARRLLGAWHVY
jgi:hypothetical protein